MYQQYTEKCYTIFITEYGNIVLSDPLPEVNGHIQGSSITSENKLFDVLITKWTILWVISYTVLNYCYY